MRLVRFATTLLIASTLLTMAAVAAGSKDQPKYSVATVKQVEKLPAGPTPATSDAPLTADVDTFHITVDLDSKTYVVEYQTFADPQRDTSGLVGKKFQVYARGKTMYVKALGGRIMKLAIVKSGK